MIRCFIALLCMFLSFFPVSCFGIEVWNSAGSFNKVIPYLKKAQNGEINPYKNLEDSIELAHEISVFLPVNINSALIDLKENKNASGYVVFKGLPQDETLPPTPNQSFSIPPAGKDSFVSEFMLTMIGSQLGEPFNYIQEEQGNIFRNIRPTKKNRALQTSDSSDVVLQSHTETAFHIVRPDYLLLYCLRSDRNREAYTLVSSLQKVLALLDKSTIEILKRKEFITGIDVSFGNPDKSLFNPQVLAVLSGSGDDTQIIYDLDLMKGLTEEASEALKQLQQAITSVQEKIFLEPGDLLAFDNTRIIHGRTNYTPYFDGKDRWLQRVYITKDKEFNKRIACVDRVITYTF